MQGLTGKPFWTGQIVSGVLDIVTDDTVSLLTIQVLTGTVTMRGSASFPNTAAGTGRLLSGNLSLAAGTVFTVPSAGPNAPLNGLHLDFSAGTAMLVMYF